MNLVLTLGPLNYQLLAYDTWAACIIRQLSEQLDCEHYVDQTDRLIHLIRQPVHPDQTDLFKSGRLLPQLAALVPENLPDRDWQISGNDLLSITWRHNETKHVFWTDCRNEPGIVPPIHLPWDLMIHDMIQRGGGIIHGGLAVYNNQGVLLTAPPGGGKTTAFSTISANWQIMSDDAVLVWPDQLGMFQVSPLPTWSVLLGFTSQLDSIRTWQVSRFFSLALICILDKSDQIEIVPQGPLDSVFPIYRALSEYPAVLMNRTLYRSELFHTAAKMVRSVPINILNLPRKGDFWCLIEDQLT